MKTSKEILMVMGSVSEVIFQSFVFFDFRVKDSLSCYVVNTGARNRLASDKAIKF